MTEILCLIKTKIVIRNLRIKKILKNAKRLIPNFYFLLSHLSELPFFPAKIPFFFSGQWQKVEKTRQKLGKMEKSGKNKRKKRRRLEK